MKINDKHLALYATKATKDKEGYLSKRGEINRNFQKRWFVLIGNLLFYYEKKDDTEPIGVIVLEGFMVELIENADRYSFVIDFPGNNGRTYVFSAETQADMEDWMRMMTCASYDYMKSAIKQLQSQLDEIIEVEKNMKHSNFQLKTQKNANNNDNNEFNVAEEFDDYKNFTKLHNRFKPFFLS